MTENKMNEKCAYNSNYINLLNTCILRDCKTKKEGRFAFILSSQNIYISRNFNEEKNPLNLRFDKNSTYTLSIFELIQATEFFKE
jgi:hypothetical protein